VNTVNCYSDSSGKKLHNMTPTISYAALKSKVAIVLHF